MVLVPLISLPLSFYCIIYINIMSIGERIMKKKIIFFTGIIIMLWLGQRVFSRESWEEARMQMVEEQIVARGIQNPILLEALRHVPRHEFVPQEMKEWAYADTPLPIGFGQTISQPFIVALMTEKAKVKTGDRVLEIGTGSGYQAAILSAMGCTVYTVEIIEKLAAWAEANLKRLGYENVTVKWGDGYFGWQDASPFDAIIVTCSVDHLPPPLLEQLKEGGTMVIPVGPPWSIQSLFVVEKTSQGVTVHDLGAVRFVPLTREIRKD